MTLLVEAVDADLRAGLTVDIALSSRIARDAVIRHLANTGVPYLMNGQLVVRSLADTPVGSAPPRATVLAAPPIARLSHRIVSADVGPLNVLCYDHEIAGLRSTLRGSLDEPLSPLGAVKLLLPPNLDLLPGPSGVRPAVIISVSKSSPTAVGSSISLSHFADAADIAGLAALATDSGDPIDLPDDELVGQDELNTATNQNRITTTLSAAVPMTVSPVGRDSISSVHIPVDASVLRILAGRMSRIPTLEVLPGMLLADLNGVTPFDRLRPLLLEARGPATRMLLTAWEQALSEALHRCGGPSGLSRSLSDRGTSITTSAVEGWSDPDRIGPRKPVHVEQVGQIAEHPIVRDHASAVAQVMHELRKLHQAVGQALAAPNGLTTVANDLEHLLGPDAASAVAETVVYRVLHIDTARDVDRSQHYVLQPFIATDPAREGHS
jgi:hypothetical protein